MNWYQGKWRNVLESFRQDLRGLGIRPAYVPYDLLVPK